MGDLVHALSAVQEAAQARHGLAIDWVCEEAFAELPKLAPCIDRIIPVANRRWRKSLFAAATRAEIQSFNRALRAREYDVVIDAQGLLKTAWITRLARCKNANRWGFDWASAREPLASLAVRHKVHAPAQWHAIHRLRVLMGAALGYTPQGAVSSLEIAAAPAGTCDDERVATAPHTEILFLHGTSRVEKSWPIESWIELGRRLVKDGYRIALPWGSDQEREQAEKITQGIGAKDAQVLPRLSLAQLITRLQQCAGTIGLDSGLMHLSVAIGRPTVAVMTASGLQKFSAKRFAPFWAAHAKVVEPENGKSAITSGAVWNAWKELC